MNKKVKIIISIIIIILVVILSIGEKQKEQNIETSVSTISSKKMEWGIKRNNNHEQPDVGKSNKKILESNNGICLGNSEKKYIYLTFDEGYEAGYTAKILDDLKEKNVKATFFITAHYVNTASDLVQRMIDEGHIVGNQFPLSQMYQI